MNKKISLTEHNDKIKSQLEKDSNINNKLEENLNIKIEDWNERLKELFKRLKSDDRLVIDQMQIDALSYQQELEIEIHRYLNILAKQYSEHSVLVRDKLLFYDTEFALNSRGNAGDKKIMLEADMSQKKRFINILENFIEYLRGCKENCIRFQYGIKNKIQYIGLIN